MKRINLCGKIALSVVLLVFLSALVISASGARHASALEAETANDEPVIQEEDGTAQKEEDVLTEDLISGFLAKLKAKYGEDYEKYYAEILGKWDSVEEYLLTLADDGDEAQREGWQAFIGWLGEYSPIWGSILAVLGVVIVAIFGKKALGKVADWLGGFSSKMKAVFQSINKLYVAQNAQSKALAKLLESEKSDAERRALEESVRAIEEEERDG